MFEELLLQNSALKRQIWREYKKYKHSLDGMAYEVEQAKKELQEEKNRAKQAVEKKMARIEELEAKVRGIETVDTYGGGESEFGALYQEAETLQRLSQRYMLQHS